MNKAILIFTFSPVQSFIAEARRAADLYVGSRILSELAKAAAQAIDINNLVYPSSLNGNVPNVIVARVSAKDAAQIANHAEQALRDEWLRISQTAYQWFAGQGLADATFNAIWERQINHVWEVFWVAAEETADYREAYEWARTTLDAVKRSRRFAACDEPGIKDTLSGQREALHRAGQTCFSQVKGFWAQVGKKTTAAKLRPEGRERLDAIGATKRFCDLADQSFPSTSTIAALDFIERAKQEAAAELCAYRNIVARLGAYRVSNDSDWPFDGDLLFAETLTANRLRDSYGLDQIDLQTLADAREALKALHDAAGGSPSPYYALLVLDGDSMGKRINDCLHKANPLAAHRQLSQSLDAFAQQVSKIIPSNCLIYNGGDDVLAFLPLSWALAKAQELAKAFESTAQSAPVPGTASAGIALVHHLHPLDVALRAARDAERTAKQAEGKAALCVTVVKRSGAPETAVVKWDGVDIVRELIDHLQRQNLAMRFVSDATLNLRAIPDDQPAMLAAELRRQMRRHSSEAWRKRGEVDAFAGRLADLGAQLPGKVDALRAWLGIARFMVRESQEAA